MRFNDLTTRTERRQHDKLTAIREVFEMFVGHYKENYTPGCHLTIDEQLVAFHGKCPFRVYINNFKQKEKTQNTLKHRNHTNAQTAKYVFRQPRRHHQ